MDAKLLKNRLDTVEAFVENTFILKSIRNDLQIPDIQRILGKINKDKASPEIYIFWEIH